MKLFIMLAVCIICTFHQHHGQAFTLIEEEQLIVGEELQNNSVMRFKKPYLNII